ncbi:unnamed protein product, partial [Arabidopsis halleri]
MRCEVTKGTHGKYEVWIDGGSVSVNLTTEEWDCSCCKWQVAGIPCEHAYAEIMAADKDVEDFVVPMFGRSTWREQYDTWPEPVRGQMYWPTSYVLITAPEAPVPPGRKKGEKKNYNRIKGKHESPKKKKKGEPEVLKLGRKGRIMHCKSCKEAGHNSAGCQKFPKKKNEEQIGGETARSSHAFKEMNKSKKSKKKKKNEEQIGDEMNKSKKTKKNQEGSTSQPTDHQEG